MVLRNTNFIPRYRIKNNLFIQINTEVNGWKSQFPNLPQRYLRHVNIHMLKYCLNNYTYILIIVFI